MSPGTTERSRMRLLCLPYAGGGPAAFGGWRSALEPEIDAVPVELPGHGARIREAPLHSITAMAGALAAEHEALFAGRYALFGYSMGALVAYEMARLLVREQLPRPMLLFVAAHAAPQIPREDAPVADRPAAEILERLRGLGGMPEAVMADPELGPLLMTVVRADLRALERYAHQPGPPLPIPITAIGGVGDAAVPADRLAAWRNQTDDEFRMRLLPGGHFFLRSARDELLAMIRDELSPLLAG